MEFCATKQQMVLLTWWLDRITMKLLVEPMLSNFCLACPMFCPLSQAHMKLAQQLISGPRNPGEIVYRHQVFLTNRTLGGRQLGWTYSSQKCLECWWKFHDQLRGPFWGTTSEKSGVNNRTERGRILERLEASNVFELQGFALPTHSPTSGGII